MSEGNPFKLIVSQRVRDELERLDKPTAQRILTKLLWLAENAETVGHEMLTGRWRGYCRWRVGDYRIIYIVDHETCTIDVALLGHRRDIYDK